MKAAALALSSILALLVAPYAGSAQEIGKMPRVAYVRSGTFASDPYRKSFLRGMRERGSIGGRNITFDFRNYGDDHSALTSVMSDLLRSKTDIIAAGGTPAIRAAQAATQSIPIVMVANDPLGGGLIQSLARPGALTPACRNRDPMLAASARLDLKAQPFQDGCEFPVARAVMRLDPDHQDGG